MTSSVVQPRQYERAKTIRLKHNETGEYLHLSGEGFVKGTEYAWVGYKRQARNLRDRALARRESWPIKAVKS